MIAAPDPGRPAGSGSRGARRLIVTADDFGLALPVNEAVEEAHTRGMLSAASLMVGAAAAADAVERARRLPGLRVGLHVVLVHGRPVLPASEVPGLVDEYGEFSTRLVRAGFAYFFKPAVRRQLAAEIRAQFEAFRATGLALDHVNAHNHMHLHPTLSRLILEVGRDYGLRAVRVPWEPPLASFRAAGHGLARRLATAAGMAPWVALLRRRLRRAGLRSNRFVFGLLDTGGMEADLLARQLAELPAGAVTEIYFHPATGRSPELDRSMPDYGHQEELAALTSPRCAAALAAAGLRPIGFSDL
jgi:hopanoid biosynthesis associated protein HpnK